MSEQLHAQHRTAHARLIVRDDRDKADTDTADAGYELRGIAVPFGEEFDTWWFTESFDRDCEFEGIDTAKLYWQHREAIGKITAGESIDAGLQVDAKISRTPRGDEAATLVRDGVIDSLSIGFEGLDYRAETRDDGSEAIVWTRVRLREVSLVSFPAYESATLTEVRHNPEKGNPPMPPTTAAPDALTRADLDGLRDELTVELRATQAQLATLGDTRTPAAPRFRSFGEFIRAYHKGEPEARSMYEAWQDEARSYDLRNTRAYDGSVLADTIAHDPWVGDAIRLIDKGRKVLNSFLTSPLPQEGTQVEYGVLESNTVQVTKQAAEGDELAKGKVEVGSDTAPIGTYGGWSELSFQTVERGSISLLDLTRRAQYIAYGQQTEAQVRAVLAATINDNLTASHSLELLASPKAADWISLLIDAADAYEDAALPIDGLWLSKDKFKELVTLTDNNGRLQFDVTGTGSNAVGTLASKEIEAALGGAVRVRLLPGSATGRGAFYSEQAITTWENAGAPLSLEDTNVTNLTRAYSVYGYLACAAEIPDAILPIEFDDTEIDPEDPEDPEDG